MDNQLSTNNIKNLVDMFVSSKLVEEKNKDDVFGMICRFLEGHYIDIVKNFNGRVCLEFDFEFNEMGSVDDVKELISQEVFRGLHSIKHKCLSLSNERLDFEDVEQDYKSEWEK